MKRKLISIIILVSLFISGCMSQAPNTSTDDIGLLNNQTTPSTAATQPPSSAPTMPDPTTPSVPMNITPINTYVNPFNLDGTPNEVGRVSLNPDDVLRDPNDIRLGETVISDHIQEGIRNHHERSVFYVAVSYAPTLQKTDTYTNETLRQALMESFEEAGYYVVNGCSHAQDSGFFYIFASAEQLNNMHCGDGLAIYIYVPEICF